MKLPSEIFWNVFKKTHGAFSTPEAIALYNIALKAPNGLYIELGSHKGKSTQAAALGLGTGTFILVEPEFKDALWDKETISNIMEAIDGINSILTFTLIADYSTNIIPKYDNYSFVFVDSGVHDDLVLEEVKMLEDRVIPNGIIAFHDYLNQFTAVERAFNYLLSTGKYEKIDIDWKSIFDYVREHNLEEGNISWHERGSEEFPKFVGALKRK